jgi:hypothetical protein
MRANRQSTLPEQHRPCRQAAQDIRHKGSLKMFYLIHHALIGMAVLVSVSLPAGAADWGQYYNSRFGTVADVPAHGFWPREPSANGDGQEWVSDDGLGQILVFGDLIVTADTVKAYRREILGYARDDGLDIVYSVAKKNWFAYSGFLGPDIVYEKVVVTRGCDPMIANHIYFRYPTRQKKRYDAIVRHMAASLAGDASAAMCN